METFSLPTLIAITEVVTGGPGDGRDTERYGVYRSGPALERLMARQKLVLSVGNSSRLPAVQQFLRALNASPEGFSAIKKIIEASVDRRDYWSGEEHGKAIEYLNSYLVDDGFHLHDEHGRFLLVATGNCSPLIQTLDDKAQLLDIDSVQTEVCRIMEHVDEDPEDAITAACSMVESVCKFVLNEEGKPLPTKKDIARLVKETQNQLNLSPARNDVSDEIRADVKQVLGGLSNVAHGIGALRTHGGDAHGKEKGARRVDARIARLAVHAASTISLFFLETWQIRKDIDG